MTNNSLIPSPDEMRALEAICHYAVESKYFQSLGGLPGVMCIAMYAKEIGVSPMVAIMGGFSNVQGKITMSAELMHSLLRGAGVRLKIIRSDSNVCEIYGKRSDTGDGYTSIYTIEDAKKANLVKSGGSWEKNPSDMLFARCISRLRRRLAPDIATKAYVEGEIEIEDEKDSKAHYQSTTVESTDTTEGEVARQFKEQFKSIENGEHTLGTFIELISKKSDKSVIETIKQAVKNNDRFSKAYLKWVEDQKPVVEVAVEETKEIKPIEAKQMNLV